MLNVLLQASFVSQLEFLQVICNSALFWRIHKASNFSLKIYED